MNATSYSHNEETVKTFTDAGVACCQYNIMTASGPAPFITSFETMEQAEAFRARLIARGTIGTNGYERHTAAFVK